LYGVFLDPYTLVNINQEPYDDIVVVTITYTLRSKAAMRPEPESEHASGMK